MTSFTFVRGIRDIGLSWNRFATSMSRFHRKLTEIIDRKYAKHAESGSKSETDKVELELARAREKVFGVNVKQVLQPSIQLSILVYSVYLPLISFEQAGFCLM